MMTLITRNDWKTDVNIMASVKKIQTVNNFTLVTRCTLREMRLNPPKIGLN